MDGTRHLKLCGLAALGLALGLGTASAQDKTFELKLSHWVPPSHPLQKAIEQWGDDIQKASNGTITYKVYPSQQLGKAFDHYDMARDGIAKLTAEPGQEVYPISDAQLDLWKAAAVPVVKTWSDAVKKTGNDPDAILKDFRADLTKYNSGY